MNNIVVIAIIMLVAGVIGAYCRYIFDKVDNVDVIFEKSASNVAEKRLFIKLFEIVVPGVVASFLVPLFLSIGKSSLFTDLAKGGDDFYVNLFILFGFCLLAAVSAKSFVNAVAQQALRTADEAKKEAVQAKDLSAEAIEGNLSAEEGGDRANLTAENTASTNSYAGTGEEKIVLSSLL